MEHSAQAANKTVATNGRVMVNRDRTTDCDRIRNVDMPAQHGAVGHDQVITDLAIMGNMHTSHQKAVITKLGDPVFLFARAIDRDTFADRIVIANQNTGSASTETDILGFTTNDGARMDMIMTAHDDSSLDHHVAFKGCIVPNLHIGTDVAERTNLDVITEFSPRVDTSEVRYSCCHGVGTGYILDRGDMEALPLKSQRDC